MPCVMPELLEWFLSNDRYDAVQMNRQLGGLNFGIPQGRVADWEYRARPLVSAGRLWLNKNRAGHD